MADYCNQDGATRLRNTIVEFWKKKGFEVDIELVNEGFVSTMRSARTDLRSNMVNGMPQVHNAEAV